MASVAARARGTLYTIVRNALFDRAARSVRCADALFMPAEFKVSDEGNPSIALAPLVRGGGRRGLVDHQGSPLLTDPLQRKLTGGTFASAHV